MWPHIMEAIVLGMISLTCCTVLVLQIYICHITQMTSPLRVAVHLPGMLVILFHITFSIDPQCVFGWYSIETIHTLFVMGFTFMCILFARLIYCLFQAYRHTTMRDRTSIPVGYAIGCNILCCVLFIAAIIQLSLVFTHSTQWNTSVFYMWLAFVVTFLWLGIMIVLAFLKHTIKKVGHDIETYVDARVVDHTRTLSRITCVQYVVTPIMMYWIVSFLVWVVYPLWPSSLNTYSPLLFLFQLSQLIVLFLFIQLSWISPSRLHGSRHPPVLPRKINPLPSPSTITPSKTPDANMGTQISMNDSKVSVMHVSEMSVGDLTEQRTAHDSISQSDGLVILHPGNVSISQGF